jgi:glycosyltransferase involved in cell wall biosynthesis
VGLLTEGGYPYATGDRGLWCDRLVRGLADHEFEVYALSRSAHQEAAGRLEPPRQVRRVRTAPLWGAAETGFPAPKTPGGRPGPGSPLRHGRRDRRRFAEHFGELAAAVCEAAGSGPGAGGAGAAAAVTGGPERSAVHQADRFAAGLYGLAELGRERGGLSRALRSETALRALESACRAPCAVREAHDAQPSDLLAVVTVLERALRPLSLDWYGEDGQGLGGVDLCHATSGGVAALPGLLAKRRFGVPLLVTEYGVRLREHCLARVSAPLTLPVRALLASFQGRLTTEVYAQAALITPGNRHARRWQERCGADPARLRTVHPGMDADRFASVMEEDIRGGASDGGRTLVWVGRVEPAKDLVTLLHAFAEVRRAEPQARLRIVGGAGRGPEAPSYAAHCRALAARLFPGEAANTVTAGGSPVSFEESGGPGPAERAEAYAAAGVVLLSSVVEGFPVSLVEAMFCGRATVSTDVGAVGEVIGGTGLVVPPRNRRALAAACVALLRDPERRARLGAAARARALELFTVEQNITAFRGIYLELLAHRPVRREKLSAHADLLPFARPAETRLPGIGSGVDAAAPQLPSPVRPAARACTPPPPGWAVRATAQPGPGSPRSVGAGAPLDDHEVGA